MVHKDLIERRKERRSKKSSSNVKVLADTGSIGDNTEETSVNLETVLCEGFSARMDSQENKPLDLIESIDFTNGQNTLSIRFSKRHNRMYRIQVFLNNESEIRPVTYTGASTGYSFWALLKGAMKK